MKRVIFYIIFIFGVTANFASAGVQKSSELTRKEKREAEREKNYQLTKQMLEKGNFVLESDYLRDRYGRPIPVMSNINFVMVADSTGVIQVGSPHGYGPNGVGGITAKGKITNWELDADDKKRSFNLNINVLTPVGSYELSFRINSSGSATATLYNLRGGRLTFDGDVVSPEESIVYEGYSI